MRKSFSTNANLKCDRIIALLHSIPEDDETTTDLDIAYHIIWHAKKKIENRMHIEHAKKKGGICR